MSVAKERVSTEHIQSDGVVRITTVHHTNGVRLCGHLAMDIDSIPWLVGHIEKVLEKGDGFCHQTGDDKFELRPAGDFFRTPRITITNDRSEQVPHGGFQVINISMDAAVVLSTKLNDLTKDGENTENECQGRVID